MSLSRFSKDCDVYIYKNTSGRVTKLVCCNCIMKKDKSVDFYHKTDLINHLKEHTNLGHKVPNILFVKLDNLMEINKNL